HPTIRVQLTLGTLVVFLLAATFSWVFCGVLFKSEFVEDGSTQAAALGRKRARRWLIFFLSASGLATVGAFVYSLKDVPAEGRIDVLVGTGIAALVLTVGGFLIHKAVRFFEEQDRVGLEKQRDEERREE